MWLYTHLWIYFSVLFRICAYSTYVCLNAFVSSMQTGFVSLFYIDVLILHVYVYPYANSGLREKNTQLGERCQQQEEVINRLTRDNKELATSNEQLRATSNEDIRTIHELKKALDTARKVYIYEQGRYCGVYIYLVLISDLFFHFHIGRR